MSCPANRLRWPVVGDSRSRGKQVAHTRFRPVGHRKGSKQLLNTSAGLVRTRLFAMNLIVHGMVPLSGSQRTNDHSEFFRTNNFRVLENQGTPLQMLGIFQVTVRVVPIVNDSRC